MRRVLLIKIIKSHEQKLTMRSNTIPNVMNSSTINKSGKKNEDMATARDNG